MGRITQTLIPRSQRQSVAELTDAVDLDHGEVVSKRTGFLIMLVLAGLVAIAGVLTDSTATVIGAMIIAPLATPIQGIGLGLVIGSRSLVGRSILWVLLGTVIVVLLGMGFAAAIADPGRLSGNSQIAGRTSPNLMDLVAALATGLAGAFAMCRRDLSAVLPGVAIAISLVPPLAVVGVCAGVGEWDQAFGALMLFLSNVFALVIAGAFVYTAAGYAREPSSSPTAKRRRSYAIVAVLAVLVAVPLAANTLVAFALARWGLAVEAEAQDWLADTPDAYVDDVTWSGLTATVAVVSRSGDLPPSSAFVDDLAGRIPDFVDVVVDLTLGAEIPVQR
ncbi:TIGR00341 family protein [Microbacterium sp. SS28]|uniref:TIGR00341 family protein n=1 Tax=Microbacterium sp. SS28 TaxID=2919948 RepID=UPI001FAB0941|nr:TIGR00341 family protein [Microbacterium sp. SS28]